MLKGGVLQLRRISWGKKQLLIWLAISLLCIICISAESCVFMYSAFSESSLDYTVITDETPQTIEEPGAFLVEIVHPEYHNDSLIQKRILIYHTHTYEAYEQDPHNRYKETEKWRTQDSEHNVIAVGKALSAALRAQNVNVVHDTTVFELPTLEQAYDRSLQMLETRKRNGETYDLYIDLHRDALASTSTIRRTINIAGEEIARFMVLVGKGTSGGYTEKPDWEANYALAVRISDALNKQHENLARNVKVKTGRFNQHISKNCLLIECGINTNTLQEVIAGIPYLADAIVSALSE